MTCEQVSRSQATLGWPVQAVRGWGGREEGGRTKGAGAGQLRGRNPGRVPLRGSEPAWPPVPWVRGAWCLLGAPGRARAQGRARPLVADRHSVGSRGPGGAPLSADRAPAFSARATSLQRREKQPRPQCAVLLAAPL